VTLLIILMMAVITFITRYLFLHPRLPIKLGPKVSCFLNFSAPAVLTAIWVPIIFVQDERLVTSVFDPYLIATMSAILVSIITKNIYWTILISVTAFTMVRYVL